MCTGGIDGIQRPPLCVSRDLKQLRQMRSLKHWKNHISELNQPPLRHRGYLMPIFGSGAKDCIFQLPSQPATIMTFFSVLSGGILDKCAKATRGKKDKLLLQRGCIEGTIYRALSRSSRGSSTNHSLHNNETPGRKGLVFSLLHFCNSFDYPTLEKLFYTVYAIRIISWSSK